MQVSDNNDMNFCMDKIILIGLRNVEEAIEDQKKRNLILLTLTPTQTHLSLRVFVNALNIQICVDFDFRVTEFEL